MNNIFAPIYEFLFYSSPFSDELYAEELYTPLGLSAVLLSLFFVAFFYYIINRPSFSRWYHWLIMLILNFIIQFAIGTLLPLTTFNSLGLSYQSEYYVFGLINAVFATLLFILLSFILRWGSTNAKRTPIPN